MISMKLPSESKILSILRAWYMVGILGFSIPFSYFLFRFLTPFSLLLLVSTFFLYHKNRDRRLWLVMIAIALLGFGVEVAGVITGKIFGLYEYGETLGVKVASVPIIIGINWVIMVYGGLALATLTRLGRVYASLLAALIMTASDFIIEKFAILSDMWSWQGHNPPLQNYISWFIISFLFCLAAFPSIAGKKKESSYTWIPLSTCFFHLHSCNTPNILAIFRSRHITFYTTFFRWYTSRMLKKHLAGIQTELDPCYADKAVLLIGNHFSWWDRFIGNYLSYKFCHKKFHVMMLREQLEKRMFLNKAGAFSVEKSSRSAVESIIYSAEILSQKGNLLMMFPQGAFDSLYHRGFVFARGVEKILEKCDSLPAVVFNINLVEYFSNPAPTLFIRSRMYQGEMSTRKLEEAFNLFHLECISKQNENLL